MRSHLSDIFCVALISLFSGYLSVIFGRGGSLVLGDLEIGQQIGEKGQEAATTAPNKPHAPDPEAQQLYLKGQELLAKVARLEDYGKIRKETLEKAVEYFEQAVAKDPNYASAYVSLAQSYLALQGFGGVKGKEAFAKVKAAASKAIEIDEKLAEAHDLFARAKFSDLDWAGAEKEFRRTRELKPSIRGSFFRNYPALLAAVGKFDEATAEVRRINELDANPSRSQFDLGFILYWARRYDEAIEHYQKAIQVNSEVPYHFYLGFAYAQKSRFKEAVEEFEPGPPLAERNAGAVAALAYGYVLAGRKEEAIKISRDLEEGYKQPFERFPTGVPAYRVAAIYAALGDKDRALEWLEKDYEGRGGWIVWVKVDPVFDGLHSDPRFQALLRRMNFPP